MKGFNIGKVPVRPYFPVVVLVTEWVTVRLVLPH